MSEETQTFIQSFNEPTLVSQGSSLKFMLLAEGKADVYPRFAQPWSGMMLLPMQLLMKRVSQYSKGYHYSFAL